MKFLFQLVIVLIVGSAFAQNKPHLRSDCHLREAPRCFHKNGSETDCMYLNPYAPDAITKREGEFKKYCYGTVIDSNTKVTYIGEFQVGKSHGQGTQIFADGSKYVGEFRDDKRNGQGTATFPNGNYYVGEFKDNARTGQGTLFSSNGSIINKGVYDNGKYIITAEEKGIEKNIVDFKGKGVFWAERVSLIVADLLRLWLGNIEKVDASEIPLPSYPATLSLSQEKWESNKEFEDRLAVVRAERQKQIDNIQNNYRQRVEQRNQNIARVNKNQLDKEVQLPQKRKELIELVLLLDKPKITPKSAVFDPESSILFVDAAIDNGGVERFEFKETSSEFRKNALSSISSIEFTPEVYVSDSGQLGLKGINSGKTIGISSKGGFANQALQLASVDIPTVVNALPLVKQTAITVDRNQVEQILYRDENESLRKRLEELRRSQELALAESLKKASAETDRFKSEAEAAKLKQRELEQKLAATPSPVNYGRALNAHALIIGNSAYSGSSKLPNPINDAKAMSAKLRSLGFKVTETVDADRINLVTALSQFSQSAAGSDVTLLFYAGHGAQISGINYMLPVDLDMNDLNTVPLIGISLNDVVEKFLPGKTKLVFLDACRDNPLLQVASRGVSRGLAPISVSEGTLIAYSTKDGQVALDGAGKNSPFTEALLNHLDDQDDIAVVLRKVRDEVMRNTGNKQQPWEYGSLTGGALVLSAIK